MLLLQLLGTEPCTRAELLFRIVTEALHSPDCADDAPELVATKALLEETSLEGSLSGPATPHALK